MQGREKLEVKLKLYQIMSYALYPNGFAHFQVKFYFYPYVSKLTHASYDVSVT